MFDSQKAYGGISNNNKNNNNYGDTSYYNNSASSNDSFWGNRNQSQNNTNNNNNRVNYRDTATISDAAIANDSLYGYNSVDNNNRQNLEQQQIDSGNKNGKYGNLASIVATSSKQRQTTWASIASQPAKSQPKSLKAKMAAGLSGTTSKHLPPSVTMDAMSWDSKNGGSKSVPPPPPTVAAAVINNPSAIHPSPLSTPTLDDELYPSVDVSSSISSVSNPPLPPAQVTRDNSLCNNNGNSSPAGSITNSDTSRQTPVLQSSGSMPKQSNEYQAPYHQQQHHNGNHSQSSNQYSHSQRNDYHTTQKPSMMMDNHYNSQHQQQQQSYGGGPKNVVAHQGSYHSRPVAAPPAPMQPPPPAAVNHSEDEDEEKSDDDPNKFNELHVLLLEKLCIENNYNPEEFDLNLRNARFFIIKSYSEDDIHRSIKYSIWCSTEHGNKRLDNAFRQQEDKGPIYLFFSVNRSGHFCGVAQMMSHVDYNASSGVWSQDKWKGQFKVKWIYIKDVPNDELRHITLENNENKPVTNSRDTQEVPYEKGKAVIAIIHRYKHLTSIFDDFLHYEKKQEEELNKRPDQLSSPPHVHKYYSSNNKMNSPNSHYPHHGGGGAGGGVGGNTMPPAPLREPPNGPMYRGNNQNYINHKPRSYNDRDGFSGGGGGGGAYRNDYHRNDQFQSQQMFPPSQHSRNNFRNNYGNDNRNRNVDYRGNRGGNDPYYRDGSGYNRSGGAGGNSGGGGNRDYYGGIPPAQPGYATMDNIDNPEFATMDHNRSGGAGGNSGGGGNRDYYGGIPPAQPGYAKMDTIDNPEFATMDPIDYRDERDYPPPRNHDRVQSWRN